MRSVVVHYKELALKGKNRPWFIRLLVRNLKGALAGLHVAAVRSIMGRIEIELGDLTPWDEARARLRRVFGIANFSAANRGPHDFAPLAASILADLGDRQAVSFRVSATRADKRLPFTSPDVERQVGGLIKEAKGWRVDLEHPALTIHVEMLPDGAFYFFGKEPGAGGMPTGTGGRVACLLSGGIDSPVAAYRMMRRGCSVLLIHFHSYPILSRASQEKVREIAALLTKFQLRSRLVLVAFGEIQQHVVLAVPPPLRVVVYRRLMLRIAERLARRWHARAGAGRGSPGCRAGAADRRHDRSGRRDGGDRRFCLSSADAKITRMLGTFAQLSEIEAILGDDASTLLQHRCATIPKESLHLPGPDFVDRALAGADRPTRVMTSLQALINHGRLAGTGYVSILPVDQGIEHSAGASFAPNPAYFDPENIVKLAIEGGCNAVASTLGVLGACSRKYAHRIPFLMKLNHNEFLSYPNKFDQIMFASVKQGFDMGATGVGATIYFGSEESKRQLQEVTEMFHQANDLGMYTVLWCYRRNPAFKTKEMDYHVSADLSGQANHMGVTIEADIIKQKLPENNGGYKALNFGKTHKKVYSELSTDHPIDLCRYQVANCYMGRAGLINSGGASSGESDMKEAVKTAVINKRAGGMGLISGRKAFQRPMKEGVGILNAIQDVYLDKEVTVA